MRGMTAEELRAAVAVMRELGVRRWRTGEAEIELDALPMQMPPEVAVPAAENRPLTANEKWAAYSADMAWSMDDGA